MAETWVLQPLIIFYKKFIGSNDASLKIDDSSRFRKKSSFSMVSRPGKFLSPEFDIYVLACFFSHLRLRRFSHVGRACRLRSSMDFSLFKGSRGSKTVINKRNDLFNQFLFDAIWFIL